MPMGSMRVKFSSGSRKRQARMGSENDPADVAIPNVAVDSQSLFGRIAPGLLPSAENSATDDVAQYSQAKSQLERHFSYA
jgi:hypothetical protein